MRKQEREKLYGKEREEKGKDALFIEKKQCVAIVEEREGKDL